MRKFIPVLMSLLFVASSVMSAETEIDDDFMRSVEDTAKTLVDEIAEKDTKSITRHAGELQGMFAQVEAHYAAKGDAADAVGYSRKSRDLSADIVKLVAAQDFDSAAEKANDIQRTCKTCHNLYKKS